MIPEQDIEHEVRGIPWRTICALAVKARIDGLSLNDIMEQGINEFLHGRPWLTLNDIADLAAALGRCPQIEIVPKCK